MFIYIYFIIGKFPSEHIQNYAIDIKLTTEVGSTQLHPRCAVTMQQK